MGDYVVPASPKLLLDDTIGPLLDIVFKESDALARKGNPEDFTFVRVRLYDAPMTDLKGTAYYRTLSEYRLGRGMPLFERYRVPFTITEVTLHREETKNHPYVGNPNMRPANGDRLIVDILTPWDIDTERSTIELQALVLSPNQHIGPKEIAVDNPGVRHP